MAVGRTQIHTRRQAAGTVQQCTNASSSEGHAECSGWEGMQPARQYRFKWNYYHLKNC